jgi:membrane protease YdiL (CAAX protease family)
LSYEAGTGEEAATRGYIQPMLREYTGSGWAANILQAAYFTAVHRHALLFVFPHALYEGWLIQRNNWQIGEGTFIHAWTDVISISTTYTVRTKKLTLVLPTLHLLF